MLFALSSKSYGSINGDNTRHAALLFFNHAPAFTQSSYSFGVLESIALGSAAGNVTATDQDGDQLTYSIKSGNTNSTFLINASTGLLTLAKHLNHHTQDSFNLVVQVADPGGLTGQASAVIIVQADTAFPDFNDITWASAVSQPYGTHEVHGEALNGKLYIFGGYDVQKQPKYVPTKRSFVYDPIAKSWASIADLPQTPNGANFGGITHEGLTTDGTDIYFAGGYPSNSTGTAQSFGTKQVWRYNVSANTYTSLPGLPVELGTGQLKYLKGKLHYMGGASKSRNDTSVHYALDLDSLSAGWKVLAPVLNATNHPGSAVYEDKIYFIGGAHHQDAASIKQKTVEVYDPNTDTWSLKADLPIPLDHISSSVIIIGDRILVLGGETAPNVKSMQVLAYSPANDSWASLTPMPSARSAGVAGVLNGVIYYTGGNFSTANRKGIPVIRVDSFTLINADNGQPIQTLISGDTLNLSALPTLHLNIRGNTNPFKVGSVQFNLSGAQINNVIENQLPYALFGDNKSGEYYAWTPPAGNYTLTATPYSNPRAAGTIGNAKTISFTVINNTAQGITLLPQADAYVRNGQYTDVNYGSDTSIQIKSSPSSGFTRYAYFRFSLDSVYSIASATLRIYGSNITNTTSISLSSYGVTDDSWTENGIDFTNAPAPLNSVLSSTGVSDTAKYYEFDVTDFVNTQFTGDKIVSLMVKDPKNSDKNFLFNSKENLQNPPQLFIKYNSQNKRQANYYGYSLTEQTSPGLTIENSAQKVKVYPNPMHKTFTVEFAKSYTGDYNLEIADPLGKIYKLGKSHVETGVRDLKIDISKLLLSKGIYYLKIYDDKKQTDNIKLIVE